MGKNTGKGKNEKEKELFEVPSAQESAAPIIEDNAAIENQESEMEMELEMDGQDIQNEMEQLVADKVKKEEIENQEQKSKRGPKPGSSNKKENETPEGEKPADKPKEKALNLKDMNIIQREIKKGRLAAPQGRIEKTDAGDYVMLLADGIIFPQDAKGNYKEIAHIAKMNDGKYILTNHAADGVDKFIARHENGESVEHEYVRVELHKPGRDKDVVELYTIKEAKNFLKIKDATTAKKEEEAKKKAEKEAEKVAKEKAEKGIEENQKKEEVVENK